MAQEQKYLRYWKRISLDGAQMTSSAIWNKLLLDAAWR